MNAMKSNAILLSALILISGCATNGSVIDSCSWVSPIFVSKDDTLTKGTADQILILNESWDEFCT